MQWDQWQKKVRTELQSWQTHTLREPDAKWEFCPTRFMKNGCLQSIFKLTMEPRADREVLPIYNSKEWGMWMADGSSDGQRQKGDENNTGNMGKESNLPHKFLGEYLATEKRNMSRNKHKELSCRWERERDCIITGRKGIQEAIRARSRRRAQRGSLKKRGAMQGELLKALGAKHSKPIETNRVPPAPSRAQRHSPQPD